MVIDFEIADKDALSPPLNEDDIQNETGSIPSISDIPLSVINELLYGKAALIRMRRVQSYPNLSHVSESYKETNKT
jgi:hypothetical protein